MELIELAERCEHGAVEDHEALLLRALEIAYPEPPSDYQPRRDPNFSPAWEAWAKRRAAVRNFVQFKADLDAAMLLIPEEMRDEIEITTLYHVARVTINMNHGADGSPFYGSNECNSIPLALCAAALRAIASVSAPSS